MCCNCRLAALWVVRAVEMLLANQARQPERLEECTKLDFLLFDVAGAI
jgi:hypothetical protein